MEIDSVLVERGSNYGDFESHAEVTVGMKYSARNGPSWDTLTSAQQEAIDMILHKIGRIVNGNPNYKDSWTDIIGYARLIERDL